MQSEFSTLIHNLVLDNPVPAKDLARAIGKPYSTLLREVNPYDSGAKLGAESLLRIMAVTGNYKPLEFMASKLGLELVIPEGQVPHVVPGAFESIGIVQNLRDTCPTCGKEHFPTQHNKEVMEKFR